MAKKIRSVGTLPHINQKKLKILTPTSLRQLIARMFHKLPRPLLPPRAAKDQQGWEHVYEISGIDY